LFFLVKDDTLWVSPYELDVAVKANVTVGNTLVPITILKGIVVFCRKGPTRYRTMEVFMSTTKDNFTHYRSSFLIRSETTLSHWLSGILEKKSKAMPLIFSAFAKSLR
jgi:hypothetical protein